jgi:hypothetical protein
VSIGWQRSTIAAARRAIRLPRLSTWAILTAQVPASIPIQPVLFPNRMTGYLVFSRDSERLGCVCDCQSLAASSIVCSRLSMETNVAAMSFSTASDLCAPLKKCPGGNPSCCDWSFRCLCWNCELPVAVDDGQVQQVTINADIMKKSNQRLTETRRLES